MIRGSVIKICPICGKKTSVFLSRAKKGKGKYCSHACYAVAERTGKRVLCKCRACGKEWEHLISQRGKDFCSYDCWNLAKRTRIEKKCMCGKMYITYPHREKESRGKFCSSECYWQSLKIDPELRKRNGLAYRRAYRKAHPEKYAASKQKRRALEIGAPGHFSEEDWKSIKNLQDNKCKICGEEKKLTVDHIKPLSRGGTNFPSNIQGLCLSCNSRKWAKI